MQKSAKLYLLILSAWLCLMLLSVNAFYYISLRADSQRWYIALMVNASLLFIAYFWLNGTKDLVYTIYFYTKCRHNYRVPPRNLWPKLKGYTNAPRVALVYCTYNDFSASSLEACLHQDYYNYRVIILDDSTKPEYKQEIDDFARSHRFRVVRRSNNIGFKAGNLNNYLQTANYDYFVILDSDEIIPRDYITRSLDYFAQDRKIGIVQANHIASRNRNHFMSMYSRGVDSHWPTYQMSKHSYGFLSLLGHGAMVSRACYRAAGGFPHMVAEDLCFSIEARNKQYYVAFASDIICEEEYPVDYLAFKKRHSKWTQGNMEFIKRYTSRILKAKMTWFEKLDIILFTYNLPLHAFFSLFVAMNVILLPASHYQLVYPAWMLIPTACFLVAPMLNDIIYYCRKVSPWRLIWYLAHTLLLYGSMFFISLKSSLKSIFGGSTFLVTPKDSAKVSLPFAVRANVNELLFATALLMTSVVIDKSPLPVIMIALPSIMSVYLSLMANAKLLRLNHAPVVYAASSADLPLRSQRRRHVVIGGRGGRV